MEQLEKKKIGKTEIFLVFLALFLCTVAAVCHAVRNEPSDGGKLLWILLDLQNQQMALLQETRGDVYETDAESYETGTESHGTGTEKRYELEETVEKQLELFARFLLECGINMGMDYTVYDLDQDGKLELITSFCEGTGRFSTNRFYQVTDTPAGVVELEQIHYLASEGEFDLGFSELETAYEENGRRYYPAMDYIRGGAGYYEMIEGAYYLEEGRVYNITYRMFEVCPVYDEAGNVTQSYTYYDVKDTKKEISEKEFEERGAAFLRGKTPVEYRMDWCYYSGMGISEQELFDLLAECYLNGECR